MRFFCQNQVISKKKVFTKIQTVFPAENKWSPKKKTKKYSQLAIYCNFLQAFKPN